MSVSLAARTKKVLRELREAAPSAISEWPIQMSTTTIPSSPEDLTSSQSRSAFRERVRTFSLFTWFGKPIEISPIVCAKYGWINSGHDVLSCLSCGAQLNVCESDHEGVTDLLISGHKENCSWRISQCPDSFVQVLPLSNHSIKQSTLDHVLSYSRDLSFKVDVCPEYQSAVEWFQHLDELKETFVSMKLDDVSFDSFCAAVLGWDIVQTSDDSLSVRCSCCQRELHCHSGDSVDCFCEHRWFCPWIHGDKESPPAWKKVLNAFSNNKDEPWTLELLEKARSSLRKSLPGYFNMEKSREEETENYNEEECDVVERGTESVHSNEEEDVPVDVGDDVDVKSDVEDGGKELNEDDNVSSRKEEEVVDAEEDNANTTKEEEVVEAEEDNVNTTKEEEVVDAEEDNANTTKDDVVVDAEEEDHHGDDEDDQEQGDNAAVEVEEEAEEPQPKRRKLRRRSWNLRPRRGGRGKRGKRGR